MSWVWPIFKYRSCRPIFLLKKHGKKKEGLVQLIYLKLLSLTVCGCDIREPSTAGGIKGHCFGHGGCFFSVRGPGELTIGMAN